MQFIRYIRKPFSVEAVQITEENMSDVARLIGDVRTQDGVTFIALDRRVVPIVTRAYVGWFVTRFGDSYRCYAPGLFKNQFIDEETATMHLFHDLIDAPIADDSDPTPPHGIPRPSEVK